MKRLCTITIAILISVCLSAQAPGIFNYQAVIRDNDNRLMANQQIGLRIQLTKGSETGSVVYVETQTPTTDHNGLINIEIGSGTVVSGSMASIDWKAGSYFIKTEIDPEGGISYTLIGASQLLSVPYAFYAKTAEDIADGLAETQGLSDVVAINDSVNGRIRNVSDPTENQDAATLAYLAKILSAANKLSANLENTMVTDVEGNVYKAISVGPYSWMTENLRTTKYNDGTDIPLVTNNTEWNALTEPAYCWYGNAAPNSYPAVTCGALYNWHTVNTDKLCPDDWSVPTEDQWNQLIAYLGGESVAGGKLKEPGTKHWMIPNYLQTGEIGFNAIPGGFRSIAGFEGIGYAGFWWSSTEATAENSIFVGLANNLVSSTMLEGSIKAGFSVRCFSNSHIIIEFH